MFVLPKNAILTFAPDSYIKNRSDGSQKQPDWELDMFEALKARPYTDCETFAAMAVSRCVTSFNEVGSTKSH